MTISELPGPVSVRDQHRARRSRETIYVRLSRNFASAFALI